MAIDQEQQLPSGVAVRYHRIVAMNINYDSWVADVFIGSYVNEAVRRAGKEPASRKRMQVVLTGAAVDPRTDVYAYLAQSAPKPVHHPDGTVTVQSPVVTGFNDAKSA